MVSLGPRLPALLVLGRPSDPSLGSPGLLCLLLVLPIGTTDSQALQVGTLPYRRESLGFLVGCRPLLSGLGTTLTAVSGYPV